MIALTDLLDPGLLAKHVEAGNIKRQDHPELQLAIYNYTAQCQYSRAWDEVTLTCRGLIVDTDSGQVVARPFRKFFNHGEPMAPTLDLDAHVVVTDKLDGSLGILYPTQDGHAIATRGSFTSEQAIHGTRVWRERYAEHTDPDPDLTYLFEIIYAANRIVLDYGDMDDLVFLGAVRTAYGDTIPANAFDWHGPAAATFEHRSLAEALAAPPRDNAEGLVVHCLATDERVKIKQEDYVALHRIITGLNARAVWQHLVDDRPIDELLDGLPDEFHEWTLDVAKQLTEKVREQMVEARQAYARIVAGLPEGSDRKTFALEAVQEPQKAALFLLLDGRDPTPGFWKAAKPEGGWTPAGRVFTEDTA